LATDAADKANQVRTRLEQFDGQDMAIAHLQDDLHSLRELLIRAQDDIHSLRQSREEVERRALADAERVRQDKNELGRRFGEVERQIDSWQEHLAGAEEHNRRNLETMAQLGLRLDALASQYADTDSLQSRAA